MEALALVAKASSRHSLFKGVTLYKPTSKWRAQISHGGRTVTLGDYCTEEEAARVFDRACICKYGKDAVCNFPLEDYELEWEDLRATTIAALLLKFKEERQRSKVVRAVVASCRGPQQHQPAGQQLLLRAVSLPRQQQQQSKPRQGSGALSGMLSQAPESACGMVGPRVSSPLVTAVHEERSIEGRTPTSPTGSKNHTPLASTLDDHGQPGEMEATCEVHAPSCAGTASPPSAAARWAPGTTAAGGNSIYQAPPLSRASSSTSSDRVPTPQQAAAAAQPSAWVASEPQPDALASDESEQLQVEAGEAPCTGGGLPAVNFTYHVRRTVHLTGTTADAHSPQRVSDESSAGLSVRKLPAAAAATAANPQLPTGASIADFAAGRRIERVSLAAQHPSFEDADHYCLTRAPSGSHVGYNSEMDAHGGGGAAAVPMMMMRSAPMQQTTRCLALKRSAQDADEERLPDFAPGAAGVEAAIRSYPAPLDLGAPGFGAPYYPHPRASASSVGCRQQSGERLLPAKRLRVLPSQPPADMMVRQSYEAVHQQTCNDRGRGHLASQPGSIRDSDGDDADVSVYGVPLAGWRHHRAQEHDAYGTAASCQPSAAAVSASAAHAMMGAASGLDGYDRTIGALKQILLAALLRREEEEEQQRLRQQQQEVLAHLAEALGLRPYMGADTAGLVGELESEGVGQQAGQWYTSGGGNGVHGSRSGGGEGVERSHLIPLVAIQQEQEQLQRFRVTCAAAAAAAAPGRLAPHRVQPPASPVSSTSGGAATADGRFASGAQGNECASRRPPSGLRVQLPLPDAGGCGGVRIARHAQQQPLVNHSFGHAALADHGMRPTQQLQLDEELPEHGSAPVLRLSMGRAAGGGFTGGGGRVRICERTSQTGAEFEVPLVLRMPLQMPQQVLGVLQLEQQQRLLRAEGLGFCPDMPARMRRVQVLSDA